MKLGGGGEGGVLHNYGILSFLLLLRLTRLRRRKRNLVKRRRKKKMKKGKILVSLFEKECHKVKIGTDLVLEKLEAKKAMAEIRRE